MAVKFLLFVTILLVGLAPPLAHAQLGLIGSLLGLIRINGIVSCAMNASAIGATTPAFANAQVQLQCGTSGTVVSTSTTNSAGVFSILLDALQFILSSLLSNCRLVVNTPLSTCNSTLPSIGSLVSPLRFIGNTVQGLLNIVNLGPAGFTFIN